MSFLAKHLGEARARGVRLGIGDDAAVLSPLALPWVWTVDAQVAGTHFDLRWLSLTELGARSLHAAVSDLAAMGATPAFALSSLVVPAALGAPAVRSLARGQKRAADGLSCPIIGGNLARGEELSVTTTVIGTARQPLLRSGARPGDEIWLVGEVGLAGAGLAWLTLPSRRRGGAAGPPRGAAGRAVRACVRALTRPRALVAEGRRLVGRARAAIDISDGLAGDLGHLASASGLGAVLEEELLVRALSPELVRVAELVGRAPLDLALSGGEDYSLLATGPARSRPAGACHIGRMERGSGVLLQGPGGTRKRLGAGFDHFRAR